MIREIKYLHRVDCSDEIDRQQTHKPQLMNTYSSKPHCINVLPSFKLVAIKDMILLCITLSVSFCGLSELRIFVLETAAQLVLNLPQRNLIFARR